MWRRRFRRQRAPVAGADDERHLRDRDCYAHFQSYADEAATTSPIANAATRCDNDHRCTGDNNCFTHARPDPAPDQDPLAEADAQHVAQRLLT